MIGKVAIAASGKNYLITDVDEELQVVSGIDITVNGDFEEVVEHFTEDEPPRILCDIRDILDYQKIGNELVKLIHRESEAKDALEDTKSLDPESEDDLLEESNETMSI